MNQKYEIFRNISVMTIINLIIRSASITFNAYLTSKTGTSLIGLFQLIMSVYSLAVTFSCAGIKLAVTRVAVEINEIQKYDLKKSVSYCVTYAGLCGSLIGFILFVFSGFISDTWICDIRTVFPLKILSVSLPFVSMSSALCGYFTAVGKIPQYSIIQMAEQISKMIFIFSFFTFNKNLNAVRSCICIVSGMTFSEILSFTLSNIYFNYSTQKDTKKDIFNPSRFFRISLPDATGTCIRSVLLTAEHLLIPKNLKKSGINSLQSLSVYGIIHGLVMPVLLYPSAILSSLSAVIIPELAKMHELKDFNRIKITVRKCLNYTAVYSFSCMIIIIIFSPVIAEVFCKNKEAVKYIRILSPLIPLMYTDIVTDGLLKGADQQLYSMKYNIIDSAFCLLSVIFIIPKYSVKGYIFILYFSEILNFYLSLNRLLTVCEVRFFQERKEDNSTFFRLKKCLIFRKECGYHTYPDQMKHNRDLLSYRKTVRTQAPHEWR